LPSNKLTIFQRIKAYLQVGRFHSIWQLKRSEVSLTDRKYVIPEGVMATFWSHWKSASGSGEFKRGMNLLLFDNSSLRGGAYRMGFVSQLSGLIKSSFEEKGIEFVDEVLAIEDNVKKATNGEDPMTILSIRVTLVNELYTNGYYSTARSLVSWLSNIVRDYSLSKQFKNDGDCLVYGNLMGVVLPQMANAKYGIAECAYASEMLNQLRIIEWRLILWSILSEENPIRCKEIVMEERKKLSTEKNTFDDGIAKFTVFEPMRIDTEASLRVLHAHWLRLIGELDSSIVQFEASLTCGSRLQNAVSCWNLMQSPQVTYLLQLLHQHQHLAHFCQHQFGRELYLSVELLSQTA
jgi:hypothetical protein